MSAEYHQLALALHESIRSNHPGRREPNLGKWTNNIRRLVENDQRTIEQIPQEQNTFANALLLN